MIGEMESFVIGEKFEEYLVRFENFLEINKVTEDVTKVRWMMHYLGKEASAKIGKACLPKEPTKHKYSEIVDFCRKAFKGEKNLLMEHYKFNARSQALDESLFDFSIELATLARECEFGNFRETALRDRFVAGIRSQDIKAKLLGLGSEATFKKVVEDAVKYEMVEKDAKAMNIAQNINQMGRSRRKFRSRSRTRFNKYEKHQEKATGKGGRSPSRHRAPLVCYNCGGTGHIARKCPSAPKRKFGQRENTSKGGQVKQLEEDYSVGTVNLFGEANLSTYKIDLPKDLDQEIKEMAEEIIKAGPLEQMETESIEEMERELFNIEKANKNTLNYCCVVSTLGRANESEVVNLKIEGKQVTFEVDTGAIVTVCSEEAWRKYFPNKVVEKMGYFPLSVASGARIAVKGKFFVELKHRNRELKLPIIIVEGDKSLLLMGRNWLDIIFPDWRSGFRINSVEESCKRLLKEIQMKYADVFKKDISEPIKEFEAEIQLEREAVPIVHKPYNVPLSLKEKVERELEKLCEEGVIEKVKSSKWASPIVVVPKPDGSIRMCGNYAVTVNPHIRTDHYKIPVIDELLANVSGYKYYVVLDLKGAYLQVKLSKIAQETLVITTHKGLFAFKRLPFGVKPASQIFQAIIDTILQGIKNVFSYIDDLIIGADSIEEVLGIVHKVLKRLLEYNVKVNWEKCHWFCSKVLFLGHIISKDGVTPNPEKVKAVVDAPAPKNTTQLKSFVGLVNYYSKFMPELSVKLKPFYNLLKQGVKWEWNELCDKTFQNCKKMLVDTKILSPYDPRIPMVVICDASNDGISAILAHEINGNERPVYFASRVLTDRKGLSNTA